VTGAEALAEERPLAPDAFERELRAIGAARYHDRHPFHKMLHGGALTRAQVQAWALNRFYYQSRIPIKDAVILSRLEDPELRRRWRSRLADHDGDSPGSGGIARWLRLCEGLGLDGDLVRSAAGVLPATRFAVDAYVTFVRERSPLEAIASSLTELFAPGLIAERIEGMIANYPFVDRAKLAYFEARLTQAPRDAEFALAYVQRAATSRERQHAALAALRFKCDVLWAQLDALHHAYVVPGLVPPGAYAPAPA
jgi:pyrroloquinoline-quinone synthase